MTDKGHKAPACTADEALERLKRGNARFLGGDSHFPRLQKEVLAELARGQQPWATILGCSDSRVPPELVFDAGFGELFIIRVAGNIVGPSIAGTLQYASLHLRTPLFLVMGHEGCGAVNAALAAKHEGKRQASRIEFLLENILPSLDGLDTSLPPEALAASAVEANVRRTVGAILQSPEGKAASAEGMKAVGAVYEISTGRVRFLS
jgi:carbonic anhydrase